MSAEHPITPPPELVEQWEAETAHTTKDETWHVAVQAARWGADMELEACCEWTQCYAECGDSLRAARRPKPPSLKAQALAAFARLKSGALCADRVTDESTIRRALEALPE
jgi:hypothetical protein